MSGGVPQLLAGKRAVVTGAPTPWHRRGDRPALHRAWRGGGRAGPRLSGR
ncbi:hypothetical protein WJ968_36790 [Achromobacter xylosoxidans]